MHEIVRMLQERVIAYPEPAVFISGGIDSTIILHHLQEKTNDYIHTFTFGFSKNDNEFKEAKRVADHYGTSHHEVRISDVLETLRKLYQEIHFPRAFFNVWMYWPLKLAAEIGIKNVYFGEGLDEHFGGYWYKPRREYQWYWQDHHIWTHPPLEVLAKHVGVNIHLPFVSIDARKTMKYWDEFGDKAHLRNAYLSLLPDFVLERKKKSLAPNWQEFYEREIAPTHGSRNAPRSDQEVREYLHDFVTRQWLQMLWREGL